MATQPTTSYQRQIKRYGVILFCLCAFFFGLIPYGGVRSSDSEVVFRVGESLALRGVFYVEHDLEDWHSFGVATGKSNRLYAIFGPLESILLAPIIKVGDLVNETGWYKPLSPILPLSHFTEGGFFDYLEGRHTQTPRPHALRTFTSFFNVFMTSFCVFVFWQILLLLTKSIPASFLVSIIYAFGTHAWPYAGTFFSEPLATLLVLLSFFYLLKAGEPEASGEGNRTNRPVFLSGIWMGLAITAHITAALYAPFFALYFFWRDIENRPSLLGRLERGAVFAVGVFILLFLLGWYNYFRFGSFFETGRTASAISGEIFGYGTFVYPFRGLYGLIFGAGKGVLFFMPALVLGAFLSKSFLRENRQLFWTVTLAVAFRVLFIASRSDWHGGFCTGPRYLVMAIPFLLIPIAFWLKSHESTRFARAFGFMTVFGLLFSIEQFYFCLAEAFSFLQIWKFNEQLAGFSVFENDIIYLDWKYSPLLSPSSMKISPFLLRWTQLPMGELMALGSVVLLILFFIFYLILLKMPRSASN
ncbi:MAG: DUF2723 domain-containing protein [Ignavibacteriales bacterium]|nr:DUF2723 domain-containing protein [Ignavibacteriales bacterium]